jgi:broad specificity phosphatase PhoE
MVISIVAADGSIIPCSVIQTHSWDINSETAGNVPVVSHKATTRIMLGIDVGRFRDRISMPAASISIVEMAVHGPLVRIMGDRSYLRDQLRRRVGT